MRSAFGRAYGPLVQPADLPGYRLGVDFGTSNTVAVVQAAGVRARPVLFDGFPLLPSSVCVATDGGGNPGGLLVGREAVHAARVHPELFEPHPKRRIDDGEILLGDRAYPVAHTIAAVLARVRAEAVRTMGAVPAATVLTCPAAWGTVRRQVLLDAAAAAGLGTPALVPEPVAAATYFVNALDLRLPAGANVVVYDFGGGTFDASVVRRTPTGWEVVASEGLPDAGGLDVDAALVGYISASYSRSHPAEVQRLEQPANAGDRRANRLLWDDVRNAKEVLSRATTTYVHLPLIEDDTPIGREQLERLARPILDRTVTLTRTVAAGAPPAAVFLVGGSSRVPLVATLLHRALGVAPTAIEQPEIVVAQGSVEALHPPVAAAVPVQPAPVQVFPAAPISAQPAMPVSAQPAMPVSAFPVAPVSPYAAPPMSAPPVAPFSPAGPFPPPFAQPMSPQMGPPYAPPVAIAPPMPPGPPPSRAPGIVTAVIAVVVAAAFLYVPQLHFGNLFLGSWLAHQWSTLFLAPAGIAWFASVFGTPSAARSTFGRIAANAGVFTGFMLVELFLVSLLPFGAAFVWLQIVVLVLTAGFCTYRLIGKPPKDSPSVLSGSAVLGALAVATIGTFGQVAIFGGYARPDFYLLPILFGALFIIGFGTVIGLLARAPRGARRTAGWLLMIGALAAVYDGLHFYFAWF
jgi:Ethanolamine utilization protein EutJ (predicted chaperonin)